MPDNVKTSSFATRLFIHWSSPPEGRFQDVLQKYAHKSINLEENIVFYKESETFTLTLG